MLSNVYREKNIFTETRSVKKLAFIRDRLTFLRSFFVKLNEEHDYRIFEPIADDSEYVSYVSRGRRREYGKALYVCPSRYPSAIAI